MSRKITFSFGEFYHLYNRGVDKRIIFNEKQDYHRFVALLYLANSKESIKLWSNKQDLNSKELFISRETESLVEIGCYCLMPNHFHILLKEKTEGGISVFMQKISTAYTMYFNNKNERTGSLFQGTFKSEHVTSDEYLKYLFSYIHLNPVKLIYPEWKERGILDFSKIKKFLEGYKYSSYLDYQAEDRPQAHILDKLGFPDYFSDKNSFNDFVDYWILFKKQFSEAKPT